MVLWEDHKNPHLPQLEDERCETAAGESILKENERKMRKRNENRNIFDTNPIELKPDP